ncbi:MAG: DUF1501 domain-containing protein [Limisphaerales bacterium]
MNTNEFSPCGTSDHFNRRTLLKAAGLTGLSWMTPLSQVLAREAEQAPKGKPAKSVIMLWMGGGPSQIETFDPHPGQRIAYDTKAIKTSAKGVQIAHGLPQTAEVMEDISLVRSLKSKEGDHERAIYNVKTGYRINPTVVHASLGSIIAHERRTPELLIPTHISIIPNQFPARGGYLGAHYDAFRCADPIKPVPDVSLRVSEERDQRRREGLDILEGSFARGRIADLEAKRTLHRQTMDRARTLMTSKQLEAFNVSDVPKSERELYGDTRFGRGCLAAVRLIQEGVRCVEVTLTGWDTHANNTEGQAVQNKILDPAFSALIKDLKKRGLLESTLVVCGGEFGRTPKQNPVGGRDHWPHGFSMALAGGGIKGGRVIGATDPNGVSEEPDDQREVEDLHTTILYSLGIRPQKEIMTDVGRPLKLAQGKVIHELLA